MILTRLPEIKSLPIPIGMGKATSAFPARFLHFDPAGLLGGWQCGGDERLTSFIYLCDIHPTYPLPPGLFV